MSKNKKILMMLTKGGVGQSDIASSLHVSKRDVSATAKAVKEYGPTFEAVSSMDADVVDDLFFPKEKREPNVLQDVDEAIAWGNALIERISNHWEKTQRSPALPKL